MTEEQMTLIKTLIKKHGISATDGEWTLVFLGASYGLTEKQIASYLIADTSDLLAKHEKMLCILFGIEPESNGEIQRMENPAERLQMLLAEYLAHNQSKQGYEEVMEYVIRDTGLSAAQIEQLRKAVEAKMPAEDVLEMAKNRKDRNPIIFRKLSNNENFKLHRFLDLRSKCLYSSINYMISYVTYGLNARLIQKYTKYGYISSNTRGRDSGAI